MSKSDITSKIFTEDQVRKYCKNNLIYDHSSNDSKKECLKKISSSDLLYLCSILFEHPINKNTRKDRLLNIIEHYFNSINRAISMKP